jgi:hypothetical protein
MNNAGIRANSSQDNPEIRQGSPRERASILSDIFGWEPLVGFLRKVAKEDLRAFGMLLGRVLPLEVESHSEERAEATYRTIEEVRHELQKRGIRLDVVSRILHQSEQIELEQVE